MVQFRAMVTPCMPTCEPAKCDIMDYTGQSRTVDSYGRKKRWLEPLSNSLATRTKRMAEPEEMLVIQTLRILDKNQLKRMAKKNSTSQPISSDDSKLNNFELIESANTRCIDDTSLIAGAIVFISIQIMILVFWTVLWKRKRSVMAKEVILPPENCSSADSLSYIYDSGIPRRFN